MRDDIIAYVKLHDGVSSKDLAELFLKFKSPVEKLAHTAVMGILQRDPRCFFGPDNLWHAAIEPEAKSDEKLFATDEFIAIHLLSASVSGNAMPIHVSAFRVTQTPELLCNAWLRDPSQLPHQEQEILISVRDPQFDANTSNDRIRELLTTCTGATLVFLSGKDKSLFIDTFAVDDSPLVENAVCLSGLFKIANISYAKPLSLQSCYASLFGNHPGDAYAYKYGEALARCALQLFSVLGEKGVRGIADVNEWEQKQLADIDFSGRSFSAQDIADAPNKPGVYGFKSKDNAYLYIGKSANLQRRLTGYFMQTDESPEKIGRIRKEAFGLVTSVCGSELECLIYEYRLIKKHSPSLNTQKEINERVGAYVPISDCVILLPHADETKEKGMSFWFKKNQKTALRPFFSDFRDAAALVAELQTFFYSGTLAPHRDDFPELEIATRWVKKHQDDLAIVYVDRVESAAEICASMKSLWKEMT